MQPRFYFLCERAYLTDPTTKLMKNETNTSHLRINRHNSSELIFIFSSKWKKRSVLVFKQGSYCVSKYYVKQPTFRSKKYADLWSDFHFYLCGRVHVHVYMTCISQEKKKNDFTRARAHTQYIKWKFGLYVQFIKIHKLNQSMNITLTS